MFDVSKLTLGEIDKVETLSGQSVAMLGEDQTPKGKMMAALAFVVKRRQEMAAGQPPTFKWPDALELTMEQANEILGITSDDADEAETDDSADQPASDDLDPTSQV